MNLELNDTERLFLVFSLGLAHGSLGNATTYGQQLRDLYGRVVALGGPSKLPHQTGEAVAERTTQPLPPSTTGTAAAKAILAPLVQVRELWAKTKNGKPPSEYDEAQLVIVKTERRDSGQKPRLIITAKKPGMHPTLMQISLWDEKLFGPASSRVQTYGKPEMPTQCFLTYSADKKYTNLAGLVTS